MELEFLTKTFHTLFAESDDPTILLGNAKEPVYLPKNSSNPYNRIYYRDNFLSSALHEICHWTIAGQARRQIVDFGYWYTDQRGSQRMQKSFLKVEIVPQALEWILTSSLDQPFFVSLDSFGDSELLPDFRKSVRDKALTFYNGRKPPRFEKLLSRILTYRNPERFHRYWQQVGEQQLLPG